LQLVQDVDVQVKVFCTEALLNDGGLHVVLFYEPQPAEGPYVLLNESGQAHLKCAGLILPPFCFARVRLFFRESVQWELVTANTPFGVHKDVALDEKRLGTSLFGEYEREFARVHFFVDLRCVPPSNLGLRNPDSWDLSCVFMRCLQCGVGTPLKRCSKCMEGLYCGRECQIEHWAKHRGPCGLSRRENIAFWETP
jgi:hypothetical protein